MKVFFVYGKDHRVNTKHSRKKVTVEVNQLKERLLQALFTAEDLEAVFHLSLMTTDDEEGLAEEDEVRWVEDGNNEEAEKQMIYLTTEDLQDLE